MLDRELKKNPFSAPEGYFDRLPSVIQDRCIKAGKQRNTNLLTVQKLAFRFAGGIAAALLLLLVFILPDNQKRAVMQTAENMVVAPENTGEQKPAKVKNVNQDAMIDYLAVRDVNVNDIILAKY
jgi:hypothetical protein